MNLFKLVDKMHDKLLYSHYLHCTAYHCWRPGFPKAIYSTGNTSRKNLLYGDVSVMVKEIGNKILSTFLLYTNSNMFDFSKQTWFQ